LVREAPGSAIGSQKEVDVAEGILFQETIRKTLRWIEEVMASLGETDPHKGFNALRAVLQALRDRLTVEEAADLGAQLPMLVRGAYYEGFRPAGMPERWRSDEEFLERVKRNLRDPTVEPEAAARAVLAVLSRHVTGGEIEQVRRELPQAIRELWRPAP
jgi:uncharacterized protein (DUF2267 family)